MTRDELMARALEWLDEARAVRAEARMVATQAESAWDEARRALNRADRAVMTCSDVILSAAVGEVYKMGDKEWTPPVRDV